MGRPRSSSPITRCPDPASGRPQQPTYSDPARTSPLPNGTPSSLILATKQSLSPLIQSIQPTVQPRTPPIPCPERRLFQPPLSRPRTAPILQLPPSGSAQTKEP